MQTTVIGTKEAPVEKLNSIIGKYSEPFKKVLTEIIGDQYCKEPLKKPLTESDVKDDQARLSLKKDWVKDHIVPLLRPGVEDLTKGIEVTTFDMEGNQFPMTFKTWSSSKMNVLSSGWKGFYQYHQLKATQEVTVGMFRHKLGTEKLCFVISFEKEKAY
ncbi:hypothetical protein F0562_009572 [Nyssa sinensis]|uniref:TF-B3 domain-containing protein n=1 Tax=Nyssa sinensis TaxID=561372 RepID=A0A5J4ZYN7_9ASTE|nr:hypothetical protein F0562_009572 [Nyssa sinensis]